jgi:hypothetical protein
MNWESESDLLYDRRFTVNQFVLATSPLRLTTSNFIFQLNTCGYSPYVTSSLRRGWACRLQLLLVLSSAVIVRSETRGTMTPFYCLRFETPPTWRTRFPYLYPTGTDWPGYTPRHWVPFSSPPSIRRVTVEMFDPGSTRGEWIQLSKRVYCNRTNFRPAQCSVQAQYNVPLSHTCGES